MALCRPHAQREGKYEQEERDASDLRTHDRIMNNILALWRVPQGEEQLLNRVRGATQEESDIHATPPQQQKTTQSRKTVCELEPEVYPPLPPRPERIDSIIAHLRRMSREVEQCIDSATMIEKEKVVVKGKAHEQGNEVEQPLVVGKGKAVEEENTVEQAQVVGKGKAVDTGNTVEQPRVIGKGKDLEDGNTESPEVVVQVKVKKEELDRILYAAGPQQLDSMLADLRRRNADFKLLRKEHVGK